MRNYGTVSPKFWIGETGKQLRGDPEAQLLALYLMTCPHSTMTGVYHCPVMYMSYETGIDLNGAWKALERLIGIGFCEYDSDSETVFVIRMAKYQIGEKLSPKDKRVSGLINDAKAMPEGLRNSFLIEYGEAFCLLKSEENDSPFEAPLKPLPADMDGATEAPPKPGTEQEQEQNNKSQPGPPPDRSVCEERFETLWSSWPKDLGSKGVKSDARAQFLKLNPDDLLFSRMRRALSAQIEHKRAARAAGQFAENFQHVERWIKKRRWEDELPEIPGVATEGEELIL